MAQRIQALLIDDLDGGEANGTVRFGLDGTEYEIDLSTAHSKELREALGQYLAHARRAGGTARSAARTRRGAAVDTAKAREWAKGQGIKVKDRGRGPGRHRRAVQDGHRGVAATGAVPRGIVYIHSSC